MPNDAKCESTDNWQHLGHVVERLKTKVCSAINEGDEFEAELSHDELTSAEWRLHTAVRLKERSRQRANAPGVTVKTGE